MLIARRNSMVVGKRLPYDAEVEYVECDASIGGRAYIELPNAAFQNDTRIEVGFHILKSPGWGGAFTMYQSENYQFIRIVCNNGSTSSFYVNYLYTNYPISGNTRVYCDCTLAYGYVIINGTRSNLGWTDHDPRPTTPMRIGPTNSTTQVRIYYFKVIDGSGAVIHDLIPVRKGNVGRIYDRVSYELLETQGTGDFIAGPHK